LNEYQEIYKAWQENPEAFWQGVAAEIDWIVQPETTFDQEMGVYGRWFPDGVCNTCYNCIDRHVDHGRAEQNALIYDSPITGKQQKYSFAELKTEVATLAAVLQDFGLEKGDRALIYMPMIPEAVFAMLACARIGVIHSVVFGGFASKELATRIDDSRPKIILTASCGLEPGKIIEYKPLLDDAVMLAEHKAETILIKQREEQNCELTKPNEYDWQHYIDNAKQENKQADCIALAATDPLYILYTSGTTGVPKGVMRDNGGHMVALKWTMSAIYGVEPGDVFWSASDVGWIVGHSYIVYGPLLHGCTTVLFEGKPIGTPDSGVFWRVIEEHKVNILFTAPTAIRAIRKEDPEGEHFKRYNLEDLRALFLAGERADPDTIKWAESCLNTPVIDHWWQTETSWTIAGNPLGLGLLPVKYGSPTVAMPGFDICILDDNQKEVADGDMGAICIKLPLPPGCFPTLWRNDKRFKESYLNDYPGYYMTADAGYKDSEGYLYIMARTDDIINVAGHRLSTGGMEEVLAEHPDVAECAVVGAADPLKGQLPVGFLVLKAGVGRSHDLIKEEVILRVREKIGPVAAFKQAYIAQRLPKTRSGKILRSTIRKIIDGEAYQVPATIDDPDILHEIASILGK